MNTRLYTVEENGVERELNIKSHVLELKPSENPPSEHYLQAMNGLKDVELSCVVSYNAETYKFLHKQYVMALAVRTAMFKLRKSCRDCRWETSERNGKHKQKRATHWYCKFSKTSFACRVPFSCPACEHFKRKSKSKQ